MRHRAVPVLIGLTAVIAVAVAVMAALDDSSNSDVASDGAGHRFAAPSEMSCGEFRFPPDRLTKPPEPTEASHPAVEVMRSLLSDTAGRATYQASDVDTSQIRVLDTGESRALLGLGDPTAPGYVDGPPAFVVVHLEPAGGSWTPVNWSGCPLRLGGDSSPGEATVLWYPTADVSPESTSIPIAVREQACASGQSAEGRVNTPVIEYRKDAVVVAVTVEPRGGSQDCPGNPPTPYVLQLTEPLGDRGLLDGGRFPPAPPADPNPPPPPLTDLPMDALRPTPDGNVTLLVANESETVNPIELHHVITGAVLPPATYRRGQAWVEYRFDLPPGLHQIAVAAVGPDGAGQDGLEEFFEVTGPTWLVLRYAGDGGAGSLTFSAHDQPPPQAST